MSDDGWLVEAYFDWLCTDAFSRASERREYEGALRVLHDIPFYWTLWSDENRVGDALSFRQFDFLGQIPLEGLDAHWLQTWGESTPSALEVLLGIARRWHLHFEGAVPYYFSHLWRNMGFDEHPGRVLRGQSNYTLRTKVDDWMSRQFEPNGKGSPFPVDNQKVFDILDMRTIDIWGQMNAYSAEHFQ